MDKPKDKNQWMYNNILYTAEFTYVDTDTGQILLKKDAKNKYKYVRIKTIKYETEYNYNKTRGTVRYTIECRKQPQGNLFTEE